MRACLPIESVTNAADEITRAEPPPPPPSNYYYYFVAIIGMAGCDFVAKFKLFGLMLHHFGL